jgi:hypothetical protein
MSFQQLGPINKLMNFLIKTFRVVILDNLKSYANFVMKMRCPPPFHVNLKNPTLCSKLIMFNMPCIFTIFGFSMLRKGHKNIT